MPTRHVVSAGEHLALIASRAGFTDVNVILQHADNSALGQRPHPAILEPDEQVTLPDRVPAKFTIATGKTHKFVVRSLKTKLKLVFKTFRGGTTAASDAAVSVGTAPRQPLSLADGALEVRTRPEDTTAVADVRAPGDGQPDLVWRLRLGHLGRAENEPGALARLRNLGYYRLVSDDADDRERRSAIEEFQTDHDMKPTGQLDDDTKAKIAEAYGC